MKEQNIIVAHIMGKWLRTDGVESVVMNYYRNIDKSKVQFHFICDEDSTDIPYDEIEKLGGKVIVVPPYQKLFKYQKELYKIFKENNYKIVHSHISTLSMFPLRIAKKAGIPIRIAHSHSTSNKKEWKRNLIKNILRPFSKVYANVFFGCSQLSGKWLFGNKAFLNGNIKIINNAIDLEKFEYNEEVRTKIREKLNVSEDTILIGHIGRFVTQKNHEFLIDVFNEIIKKTKQENFNSKLILIGQGNLKENIIEKIKYLGLQDYVIFTGQINNVSDYYNAMDIFVLPSLYEGLPVVGIEAQANGLLCEFSTDMTKETKVLNTTRFISLKETAKKWAEVILEDYKNFKRIDSFEEMTKNNFNIKEEAKKIEEYYKRRYK